MNSRSRILAVLIPGAALMAGAAALASPTGSADSARYDAEIRHRPTSPRAGEPSTLRYVPTDPAGRPVRDLAVVHERLSHTILVSKDLSFFDHVHAERAPGGAEFVLPYTFPAGGRYVAWIDFTPAATGRTELVRREIAVAGTVARPAALVPTDGAVEAGGLRVSLSTPAKIPRTGTEVDLAFEITRPDGVTVTDLQPFLGAPGHLVIISRDLRHFVHAHPSGHAHGAASGHGTSTGHADHAAHGGPSHDGHASAPAAAGPMRFRARFPAPGRYKLWLQLRRADQPIVAPFVVEVREGGR